MTTSSSLTQETQNIKRERNHYQHNQLISILEKLLTGLELKEHQLIHSEDQDWLIYYIRDGTWDQSWTSVVIRIWCHFNNIWIVTGKSPSPNIGNYSKTNDKSKWWNLLHHLILANFGSRVIHSDGSRWGATEGHQDTVPTENSIWREGNWTKSVDIRSWTPSTYNSWWSE